MQIPFGGRGYEISDLSISVYFSAPLQKHAWGSPQHITAEQGTTEDRNSWGWGLETLHQQSHAESATVYRALL